MEIMKKINSKGVVQLHTNMRWCVVNLTLAQAFSLAHVFLALACFSVALSVFVPLSKFENSANRVVRNPIGIVHVRWDKDKREIVERAHLFSTYWGYVCLWISVFLYAEGCFRFFEHHQKDLSTTQKEFFTQKRIRHEITFLTWTGFVFHLFAGGLDVTTSLYQLFTLGVFGKSYFDYLKCHDENQIRLALSAWTLSAFCCALTACFALRQGNEPPRPVAVCNGVVLGMSHVALLTALFQANRNQKEKEVLQKLHCVCFFVSKFAVALGLIVFNLFAR